MAKKNLWLFYSSVSFRHLAYGIIIPTLIIWQNKNGLSFSQIAFIQSMGLLIISLIELPSSFFADKIGRKITLYLGFLSALLAFFILIFAKDFLSFLWFQIFFSVGLAFFSGTEETFLHDIIQKNGTKLTRYLGSMSIFDEIGTIVGMLISSIVIYYFDIVLGFQIAFGSIFLAFIFVLFIRIDSGKNITESEEEFLAPKHLFSHIGFPLLLLLLSLGFFAERGEMVFQNRFDMLGISFGSFGLIYIIGKIFSILGSKFSYICEEKFSASHSLIFTGILQAIAFALLLGTSKLMAIFAICVFFFSENIFRNIRDSFLLRNSKISQRATNISLVSLTASFVVIFTKLTVGWALDVRFFYAILFVVILKILASLFLFKNSLLKKS